MSRYTSSVAQATFWREDGRLYLIWRSAAHWDDIRAFLKMALTAHGLRYDPTRRLWTVPAYSHAELTRALSWLFAPEAITWADREPPRYRASQGNQGASVDAAYATLHLLPTAPPELVTAAHRICIRQAHPDAGGVHAQAVAVNAAIAAIREHQHQEHQRSAS